MTEDKELVWKKLSEPYRPPLQARPSLDSVAIGYKAKATGNYSIAIGTGASYIEKDDG